MRQVFLNSPWVHQPADPELVRFINSYGRYVKLPAGGCIFNGGDRGEIALVLSGLGAFSFQDSRGHHHIFSLILPGRLMGDVDGVSGNIVNVTDFALRETDVRMISRESFMQFLTQNPEVMSRHGKAHIADHESDMEGMIANFTLRAPERIAALFESLVENLRPPRTPEGLYQLDLSLTTIEISQIVSAARPTVSSILSSWKEKGLLRKCSKKLCVSERLFAELYDWTRRGATPGAKIRKRRHAPQTASLSSQDAA